MKSKIVFLSSILLLLCFSILYSCSKSNNDTKQENIKMELLSKELAMSKPIFRFTWSGGNSDAARCGGGRCGICLGLCIKFGGALETELLASDITSDDGFMTLY